MKSIDSFYLIWISLSAKKMAESGGEGRLDKNGGLVILTLVLAPPPIEK
jgi:hypothetical protein